MADLSGIPSRKVAVLVNNSAIGDTVCTLPAVLNLFKHDALYKVFSPPHFSDLYRFFLPEDVVEDFDANTQELHCSAIVRHTFVEFITTLQTHLVDYSSMVLSDTILEDRSYPQVSPMGQELVDSDKYVVIATNHSSPLKRFRRELLYAATEYVQQQGCTPVWVGKKYQFNVYGDHVADITDDGVEVLPGVVDLRDKTDVKELVGLCYNSAAVVGMDGGVIHVAGLTPAPIVCAYTHKAPRLLMPIRNNELGHKVFSVVPPPESCRFCMSSKPLPAHSYTTCRREDIQCVENVQQEEFINAIGEALNCGT